MRCSDGLAFVNFCKLMPEAGKANSEFVVAGKCMQSCGGSVAVLPVNEAKLSRFVSAD